MGIEGLIQELPGGLMAETIRGFSKLTILSDGNRPIDLDAGGLVYVCALRHKETYSRGIYDNAAREFQRSIILLGLIYKWDFSVSFDGIPPPEKCHERRRRQSTSSGNGNTVVINSTFIAICANICRRRYVNYAVAPAEADMQVGRRREGAVIVCNDSDLLAYGHKLVVFIGSWGKEEARVVDLETPMREEVKERFPLYFYYHRYGLRVFHYWAAVMGCDISADASGIKYAGRECFFAALRSFDDVDTFTTHEFAKAIWTFSQSACRLAWGPSKIKAELNRVAKWFSSDGTYYDDVGNVHSISGGIVQIASRCTVRHMRGELDPKSAAVFSDEQKRVIRSIQPHNLQQNSATRREAIHGLSLPPGRTSLADCRAEELKTMLIARAGNVTDRDGSALRVHDLKRHMAAFLSLESENSMHSSFFNRAKNKNGHFANIDTSERKSVPQIVNQLVNSTEFEDSLHRFFVDIAGLLSNDEFTDDYATIAIEAPELKESFIHESFVHVGENVSQKSIACGLQRVLDMDQILYHANARSEDGKSIYILSKQRASQTRDEKTRSNTAPGEKPKLREYLVLVQCLIQPTTIESHGHTLGVFARVMRSYCAMCVAGCGMCYHRACCLWMQHLHWGEERPTPKPPTSEYCKWIPGSRGKRNCSSLQPATKMNIMRLPSSNAEAEAKIKRGRNGIIKEGLSACYDIFRGNEKLWEKLNDPEYTSARRISHLFKQLELAKTKSSSGGRDGDD